GYSSDGTTLAVAGRQFSQAMEAPFRGREEDVIQLWDTASNEKKGTLKGHRHPVLCLGFSADGQTLASGASDATARIWDVATFQERHQLDAHERQVGVVALSHDGKTLATAAAWGSNPWTWEKDLGIRLWDV